MPKRKTQMYKPKNAAEKKNHIQIRFVIRQALLKRLNELSDYGGPISTLDDCQICAVADRLASVIMLEEKINISLKREKPC
jgi:hypothetical protein